ncbi:DUF4007 family protein [Anaerobiospirillum thomasii]|uniref:DUF4007 domain-containing protein n=1 Tax=Anaerobiospirillum thomasii TaxID=179995 RepID=A0A2X0V501_9GAMM|nr:DUF4007 family protein [Anaerobiospirillum thomasii]SPT69589.1 Uncharacterised protein [Anaerobiospirillum thomasii]
MVKSSSNTYVSVSFSGHQTFPLKLLWPYKVYHYFYENSKRADKGLEAMLELGLGSNMVSSAIFWSKAIGIIDSRHHVTSLGKLIFGTEETEGLDIYGEKITTLYLYHWILSRNSGICTTICYLFNKFEKSIFTRDELKEAIKNEIDHLLELRLIPKPISENTINKDVDTILRMYCPSNKDFGKLGTKLKDMRNQEEVAEYIFLPSNLIDFSDVNQQKFILKRSRKEGLSAELFAFCLLDFWTTVSEQLISLDFEDIKSRQTSPGMIFRLDDDSLHNYMTELKDITDDLLEWSVQTGIRHVIYKGRESKSRCQEIEQLKQKLLVKALQNDN